MPKKNDWQSRFGAKRRAIDRALLAEVEQQIAREEKDQRVSRETIAKAFGRPLQ
jgi:hypothetical protein